jgi:hypothetical protein
MLSKDSRYDFMDLKNFIQKMAISTFLFVLGLSVCAYTYVHYENNNYRWVASNESTSSKKTIFIGVDGFSRDNFDYARASLGYFKMFNQVSSHIAPFPSISDYSWNIIMHSREVHGRRGAIDHYEGNFYDYRHNQLMSDSREYFRRIGSSELYFNGFFDYYLNPYVEALLYFPTEELPKLELKQLEESIIESGEKPVVMAMIASVDALAHTRADSLNFLKDLDGFLINIKNYYDQKGIDVEIILVSDHGQTSRTKAGEELLPLLPINITPPLTRAGLHEKIHLIDDTDVVIPVMALGNYVSLSFKNLDKRKPFVEELKKEEWFEQAFYIEKAQEFNPQKMVINISAKNGDAKLEVQNFPENPSYRYISISGNPLAIPENAQNIDLSDRQAREITMGTNFPDSLFRLAQMARQDEAQMPDLIVTTTDAFRVSGQFDKMTSMFQTHGSLSKRSTLGIVATTKSTRKLPHEIRTKDILSFLEINPQNISKSKNKGFNSNSHVTYNILKDSNYKGIETGAGTFSNERIFGIVNNAVNYSRYVFDMPTLGSLSEVFRPIIEKFSKTSPEDTSIGDFDLNLQNMDTDQVLGTKDFALITDLIIKYGDIDKIQKDPRFIELKTRLTTTYDAIKKRHEVTGNKDTINSFADVAGRLSPYSRAGKRITMKGYSTTFLLEKALELPEFPYMDDKRDLTFWKEWEDKRSELILRPDSIKKESETIKRLFYEIFQEQQYAEDIAPVGLPLLYNHMNENPKDVTIVYVPGIYNAIFDNEIFQMGLDSLANNIGARVIETPVISACSSEYNANIILETLKKDMQYRADRNLSPQKYFLIGYSKGGVDSLHAFAKDPEFVQKNITGLLTIAAPLSGSSILNRTDLPITLLGLLSPEVIPDVCQNEEKAAISITPAGAQLFLQKNTPKLIGLTRYYSVSFKSNIKDSHLFMKATKNIAGFTEENDGVVTLSSSRFPEAFAAIDLGVVNGDHLSGIVASKFPQQAFMQSLYLSLLELDAFNPKTNAQFNNFIKYQSPLFNGQYHEEQVGNLLGNKDSINQELESAKSISDDEKKLLAAKVEEMIKNAVKDTPYDLNDFSVNIQKDGKVEIVFAKALEDKRYMMFWKNKEKIQVTDADQIIKVLISKLQKSGRNLLAANVELWRTYPISGRAPIILPQNELAYNEDFRINLRELDKFMKGKKVAPIIPANYPQGIDILYDHRRMADFRKEYQFDYESTAPLTADENESSGWMTVLDANKHLKAKLSSNNSSIRLTTYAIRFKPQDFPRIHMDLQIDKSVPGANVLFGGTGKDDSAFQIWFTLRELKSDTDRTKLDSTEKMRLFGYYFGDKVDGANVQTDQVYENYYSRKNFIVAVLPEAKQIPFGVAPEDLKKPLNLNKNFFQDLKRSFPDINPEQLEVVGITLQHDSNDMKGSSEAYFKEINFLPDSK